MVCPLLFPTSYGGHSSLQEEMASLEQSANTSFSELKKDTEGLDLVQSYHGLEYNLFPLKNQKIIDRVKFDKMYKAEQKERAELEKKVLGLNLNEET